MHAETDAMNSDIESVTKQIGSRAGRDIGSCRYTIKARQTKPALEKPDAEQVKGPPINVIGEESVTLLSKPEARRMEVPQMDIGRRNSKNLDGQPPCVLPADLPWSRRAYAFLARRPLGKDRTTTVGERSQAAHRPTEASILGLGGRDPYRFCLEILFFS